MSRTPQGSESRERGMASILITMVTMIVISLIVLGFATVARREQGQSLDRQLSTQAFYAAESGVEDARQVIKSALGAGVAPPAKTDCDTPGDNPLYPYPTSTGSPTSKISSNVSYSCLIVDPAPPSLKYNSISTDSQVIPINTATDIDHINIVWSPSTKPLASQTTASCPSSTDHTFTNATKWNCQYGLIRMDIVPTAKNVNFGGGNLGLSRDRLEKSMVGAFFEPNNNPKGSTPGSIDYLDAVRDNLDGTPQPIVAKAKCDQGTYGSCTARLSNMNPGTRSYTLRMVSMYQASDVVITAYSTGDDSQPMKISGGQAMVDVTGKAQDVLRRIQVRLSITLGDNIPSYAIQTNGSLCKRFETTPGYLNIPGNFPTGNQDDSNAMCLQNSVTNGGTPQAGG